jgi:hypothetical protein
MATPKTSTIRLVAKRDLWTAQFVFGSNWEPDNGRHRLNVI